MRRMLAGIIWAVALYSAPAPLMAQAAGCCARDTAQPAGMHTRMEEWDRALEAKLADRAKGDTKVAAMAAVVRELLSQRREMHQGMAPHPASHDGCGCGGMEGGHSGHRMPDSGRKGGCPRPGTGGGIGSP